MSATRLGVTPCAAFLLWQGCWRQHADAAHGGVLCLGSKSKDASENGTLMGKIVWRDTWLVLVGQGAMYALRYLTGDHDILLSDSA